MSGLLRRPATVAEALAVLAGEEGARALAGGATLVAMMNAGLVEPAALVALDGIAALRGISQGADGSMRIGAMTRHRETAADARLTGTLAVVREAAGVIANPAVRNMGTMGGSISFADPAADYPPALVAAGAEIEIAGPDGARRVAAEDFFVDWYETALAPGELVVAIHLPPPAPGVSRYHKLARVSGDFAIVSCALVMPQGGGAMRVAIGGCGPKPVRDAAAEARLVGEVPGGAAALTLGRRLAELSDPVDDVRGSAVYRRRVIPRMVAAAFAEAGRTGRAAA